LLFFTEHRVGIAGDSAAKQHQASASIRSLAERHLGGIYRRLEDLRCS